DVQGVPLELTVTSLRTVNWRTFGINFFLVVEPGVLEDAPQQRLAAFQLPRGTEQKVQDELAALYPNVTLLRIREIL
ncbi:MAG TPA: ABC transporter permease, partial [Acidobacteria bacterium]|nr:ABC transporter permease [Acidobacteriota bacterium]